MAEDTSAPVEHPEQASAAASHLGTDGLHGEGPSLATAVAVGVGVAILQPELIPGVLIGAGAVLAPKLLPTVGGIFRPLLKTVVKAGYSAAMAVREVAAEAGEQVEDIVAEAKAEHQAVRPAPAPQQPAPEQARRERRPSRPTVATSKA